ncbi:putative leucine-rich repeat-containing protein DDB_G0290503 isoform X2 [Palaemon carinicauda]|uniref:putative leucine-rich repeat-containing protein DDB_G0290503 isoform X2 n=1 Tax=Palaemon carinicauda TaxID=392227 RepID=UPI0035B64D6D
MNKTAKVRHLQIITPEEELENLRNEVGVLQRTVESKSAAVAILRTELQECQKERDKFRTLAEDETLHRSSKSSVSKPAYSDPCRSAMLSGSEGTLAQLLSICKEENKTLRLDCTELRCKLHDAQADIKVLREEMQRLRGTAEGRRRSLAVTATSQLAHQEREQFISQMESLSSKCQALEGDVRGLVEEREELVRELDASSHKIHRLNYILNTILSNTSSDVLQAKRIVDLDSIITENRYLQERLKQTEEEKNLIRSNASKYKNALEKCRTQGTIKLGTPENLIVTPKQVGELLRDYHGEVGGAAETDLKSMCVALVDALNQRSRALRTQRSANKVLANRVSELERRLAGFGNSDSTKSSEGVNKEIDGPEPQISSLSLMEGYNPPSGPLPKYSEEMLMKDPRLLQLLSNGVGMEDISEDMQDRRTEESIEDIVRNHDRNSDSENNHQNPEIPNIDSSAHIQDTKAEVKLQETVESKNSNGVPVLEDKYGKPNVQKQFKIINQAVGECGKNNTEVKQLDSVKKASVKNKVGSSNKHSQFAPTKVEQTKKSFTKEVNKLSTKQEKVSTYVNPEDELEEIVPIDKLDFYIKEVQMKRKNMVKSSEDDDKSEKRKQVTELTPEIHDREGELENPLPKEKISSVEKIEDQSSSTSSDIQDNPDNDESFDLDISDYDSDNDNLDLALQDWQNDFDKYFPGNKEKKKKIKRPKEASKKPSGKEKFHFWQKDKSQEPKISPALQEFFDKAAAEVEGEGM